MTVTTLCRYSLRNDHYVVSPVGSPVYIAVNPSCTIGIKRMVVRAISRGRTMHVATAIRRSLRRVVNLIA